MELGDLKKVLYEHLNDLSKDDLKTFHWHMTMVEREGTRPVAKAKIQNATLEDTVDKLVELYAEDAAEVTVEIFREMKRNDLAAMLTDGKMFLYIRSARLSSGRPADHTNT